MPISSQVEKMNYFNDEKERHTNIDCSQKYVVQNTSMLNLTERARRPAEDYYNGTG